ncbi:MAG: Glu-tRNA(Gln) amidotransferase GatDE subunit D, partial [Desulfurococcales archaeon]|nr:Glu-tRNA(Gln) amidotransferase GatDE subunit D [Desulfurococcales archaeon]
MDRLQVKPGERVRVERDDGLILEGIVMPRYELASPDHIVLKLDSGYNVGVKISRIKSIQR